MALESSFTNQATPMTIEQLKTLLEEIDSMRKQDQSKLHPICDAKSVGYMKSEDIVVDDLEFTMMFPFSYGIYGNSSRHDGHGGDSNHEHQTDDILAPSRRLEQIVDTMTAKGSKWHEFCERIPGAPIEQDGQLPIEAMQAYSEFLYFHPFAQAILYSTRDDIRHTCQTKSNKEVNRNMRTLRREDLETVSITWYDSGEKTTEFNVENCEMFLFDTGIGVACIRLRLPNRITDFSLKDSLNVLDYIRRLHAPYWAIGDWGTGAGHCGIKTEFKFKKGGQSSADEDNNGLTASRGEDPSVSSNLGQSDAGAVGSEGRKSIFDQIIKVHKDREPPTAQTWLRILAPLIGRKLEKEGDTSTAQFQYVMDERCHLLTRLIVKEIDRITPADWVRLANVDDAGDSFKYTYSPKFIEASNFQAMTYDRFWDNREIGEVNPSYCSTRWLSSGYHLTVVGRAEKYFNQNELDGLPVQCRRHYYKLYLIAQLQLASILLFKRRIAGALDRLRSAELQSKDSENQAREHFARRVYQLESEFLHFRNTYWFPDVTNQVQGREMFALVKRHLNTQQWFDSVESELRCAASLLQSRDVSHSVAEIRHMQTNIEWVELFLIGVYAIELPYAFGHIWGLKSNFFSLSVTAMAVVTIGLFARLTKPWAHERKGKKHWILIGIAIAWAIILAVSIFIQGTGASTSTH